MAAGKNFAFKIAAKPHMVTYWQLIGIRQRPNGTIADPYNVRFSHNTWVTDDRQTHRTQRST